MHAALVLVWPEKSAQRETGRVEVLDVTLMKHEPPRVMHAPEPASNEVLPEIRPQQHAEKPTASSRTATPAVAARVAESARPPQMLALTQPVAAEPEFTIAQPTTESPPARDANSESSARTQSARASTPGPQVTASAPVTPPNFNAAYLNNPAPRYPAVARRKGEQGMVTLKVLVTREGMPASVSVETTSGFASLDQAAADAVKGWRFAPARQGPQAVEAWVLVPIVFRLEG